MVESQDSFDPFMKLVYLLFSLVLVFSLGCSKVVLNSSELVGVNVSGDRVVSFGGSGVVLDRPLSVVSSGLSVGGGLELTGSSSNSISSLSTLYLESSGSDDIVLSPGGEVGVGSFLSVGEGGSFGGDLDLGLNRVEGVASADSSDDVVPKGDLSDLYVDQAGDSMSGDLDMVGSDVLSVGDLTTSGSLGITGGNVGIGTTSPGAKLDVNGDIYYDGTIRTPERPDNIISSPNGWTSNYRLYNRDGKFAISRNWDYSTSSKDTASQGAVAITGYSSDTGAYIDFKVENTDTDTEPAERMRIESDGNVGIGTTDPSGNLQVGDDTTHSGTRKLLIGGDGLIEKSLEFYRSGTTDWRIAEDTGEDFKIEGERADEDFRIIVNDGGSSTTPFFIDSSNNGNVGIGTNSPSDDLHINDRLLVSDGSWGRITTKHLDSISGQPLQLNYYSSGGIVFNSGGGNSNFKNDVYVDDKIGVGTSSPSSKLDVYNNSGYVSIRMQAGSDSGMSIGVDSDDGNKFKIGDSWNPTSGTHLTVDQSGNVGIGTTTPGAKLDVNGEVQGDGLDIDGTADISSTTDIHGTLDMNGNAVSNVGSFQVPVGSDQW